MQKMLTCKEAADLWNFTERWVSIMCKEGRIPGAVKQGHKWMIPADTQKPVDSRIKTGAYRKEGGPSNLPLPAGVSDTLRLVRVGDYDICACAGDHVGNTSEIPRFKIISHDWNDGTWRVRFRLMED